MAEIQGDVTKYLERSTGSRLFHAKNDAGTIGAWKLNLNRTLHIFNVRSVCFTRPSLTVPFQTELAMNNHVTTSDIHRDVSEIWEEIIGRTRPVSAIFHPSTEC